MFVEKFYFICAVIGGTLFLLRSILMFCGLGDDGGDGPDAAGALADDPDGSSPIDDFKLISMHSLTSFLMMFGLSGFLLLRAKCPLAVAVAASLVIGVLTMFIIAKIFQSSRRLQSDGTIYLSDAVGATGSVYLTIRPGETGQVEVTVRGAKKIFDARCVDAALSLPTGTPVRVAKADGLLLVEPLDGAAENGKETT